MSKRDISGGAIGPRPRRPQPITGQQYQIRNIPWDISMDKKAFSQFAQSQGVRVTHYRAMPDPTGMASRGDTHGVMGNRDSSDGFIYKKAGEVTVLFTSNSDNWESQQEGNIQYSTATCTLPDRYDDNKEPLLVAPFDRLYIEDIEVRVINMQYIESNSNGVDRLQFPATYVESLVDSDKIEYHVGQDFEITHDGDIKWLSQRRPGWNTELNRGKIYAIRYRYVPFFIISRLMHEIRVTHITDPSNFKRYLERMPYQVSVIREYVSQDKNQDPTKPVVDHRFQLAPPVGGAMGPK